MAIVLTNGKKYIAHSSTGAVIKVSNIEQAYDFYSVERAIRQKNKAHKKCAGFYYIDTGITETAGNSDSKQNRKNFSVRERIIIYRKTHGHCYLCGEFVDFDSFEIEHKVPLSKGGTNELSNLCPACHCCNTIKHDIYLQVFIEKISQIFMYQMEISHRNSLRWRVIHNVLKKMK